MPDPRRDPDSDQYDPEWNSGAGELDFEMGITGPDMSRLEVTQALMELKTVSLTWSEAFVTDFDMVSIKGTLDYVDEGRLDRVHEVLGNE